jgi:mycofactocin system glycosyltransferase
MFARRLVDAGIANPCPATAVDLTPRDVAVVIPVRDAAVGLARTLASIGQVGEVIIVDDASSDARAVRELASGARILRNARSLGPGSARDRGWRATSLPVVAFVDAEVEVPENWLAALLGHLGDALVGAVAPRVTTSVGLAPRWLADYEVARSSLDLGPVAGPVRPGSRVPYVPTAALVVRREALESIGGFDEQLRVGEDVDLVWRLHARGWRVRYEPSIAVTHPSRTSFRAWVRQRVSYGTSAAPLAHRDRDAVAPLRISGWSGLAWSAIVLGRPILGMSIGAGTTAALVAKLGEVRHPVCEAVRIAGKGNLWAGRQVAEAICRSWWPLAALLAFGYSEARPALLAAAVIPPLLDWQERRPDLDPIRFTLLRLIDDVAYGAGVWLGCVRTGSISAVLPSFTGPLRPVEVSHGRLG